MSASIVIFDLDGTLIDTIGDLSAAVEYALRQGGFPGHTVDEYRSMVGHGIRNLVTRALPEGSSVETIDLSLSRFLEYYTKHIDVLSRPYPGIHEMLGDLSVRGIKLAVTSNKFQAGTETLIRRFFPDIPFAKILGNAPGLPLKPDPEVVRLAIEAAFAGFDAARPDSASLRFAPYPGKWSSESTLPHSSSSAAAGCATGHRPYSAAASPERSRRAMREWTRPRSGGEPATPLEGAALAVLVGDSATDIRTARNAGIGAIGVSWGFRPKADLAEADIVVDTVDQLKEVLLTETINT